MAQQTGQTPCVVNISTENISVKAFEMSISSFGCAGKIDEGREGCQNQTGSTQCEYGSTQCQYGPTQCQYGIGQALTQNETQTQGKDDEKKKKVEDEAKKEAKDEGKKMPGCQSQDGMGQIQTQTLNQTQTWNNTTQTWNTTQTRNTTWNTTQTQDQDQIKISGSNVM